MTSQGKASVPQIGEFRVARLRDVPARLVLVSDLVPDEGACSVLLVSNEWECATDKDVLIEPKDSGLAYRVIVESDLTIPLFVAQLDESLGRLAPELRWLARPMPDSERVGRLAQALPLLGRRDARWRWKEQELRDLWQLAGPCFLWLVDGVAWDDAATTP